ncbi:MAG: RDD family protein [Solirubrobacterales bacterium]
MESQGGTPAGSPAPRREETGAPAAQGGGTLDAGARSGAPGDTGVLGRRVGAILIDALVLIPVVLLLAAIMGQGVVFQALAGIIGLLYFGLMEARDGQTLGKKALGIRVVSDDGTQPQGTPIAIRTVLRIIDGLFVYLVGFLVALFSDKNQRLGDMAGGTLVVRD